MGFHKWRRRDNWKLHRFSCEQNALTVKWHAASLVSVLALLAGCGGGTIGFHAALDSNYGWAEYAELLTRAPASVDESDLEPMRAAGMDEHEILEAVQVIGMFNMTNRVSTALGMVPNPEYHAQDREHRARG